MGEVVEHNGEEVGGGGTRRSNPNRSSKRSPLGLGATRSEGIIIPLSFTLGDEKKSGRSRALLWMLTDAAAVDWRGTAGVPVLFKNSINAE